MENKITETQVRDAFAVIVKNQDAPALNYAVNYAKAGLQMTGHELYVQVLYVQGNISRWRGDEAKAVRETLKQYVKENKKR